MAILIDIPEDIERVLRGTVENLDEAAKEAMLVELFRQGKLKTVELSRALGISRLQLDEVLKRHEVYYDLTVDDVVRESESLSKLRDDYADRR